MYVKGSDTCGVGGWIQQLCMICLVLIPTEKRLSLAPTACTDNLTRNLRDKVSAVFNQLAIDSEHVRQSAFDLILIVIGRAERSDGNINECLQCWNVFGARASNCDRRVVRTIFRFL